MVVDANGKILYVAPPSCVGCETEGGAPGSAYVGEGAGMLPGEPVPVGLMRTNYASALLASHPGPLPGSSGAALGAGPVSLPPSSLPPMNFTPTRRPDVVSRMLGLPRWGAWRDARLEHRKSQHAAIRYDQDPATATSVPASLIYRR
jgi:hypothetical protein